MSVSDNIEIGHLVSAHEFEELALCLYEESNRGDWLKTTHAVFTVLEALKDKRKDLVKIRDDIDGKIGALDKLQKKIQFMRDKDENERD